MPDGLELNAGSGGATLATDDAGAPGHVQIVKLAISADGSATALNADNTNGLDVDVTRVGGTWKKPAAGQDQNDSSRHRKGESAGQTPSQGSLACARLSASSGQLRRCTSSQRS